MSTPLLPNVPPISPDFSECLKISKDQPFALDLSESTLLGVIEERIKMKQIISLMYGKGLNFFLKKHLKVIEEHLLPSIFFEGFHCMRL